MITNKTKHKKAVILLSGGLDSTTCLAVACHQGYDCYAISFDYGQKHRIELAAAKKIAKHYHSKTHLIVPLNLSPLNHSALTNHQLDIPDYQDNKKIPATYVPARNTIFLSMALAWAEVLEAYDIFIGVSAVDYSGYPDCRPEFITAFENMANLATKISTAGNAIKIHTPLIQLSKAQTIQLGCKLNVDYGMTISCYQANESGKVCNRCDSCMLRQKGFTEAGIKDPAMCNHT